MKNQVFTRAICCEELEAWDNELLPSKSVDYFSRGIPLVGLYAGDPIEWIPSLVQDELLPDDLSEICIVEFSVPEGTPFIRARRELRDFSTIQEEFVITKKSVEVSNVRTLTVEEKKTIKKKM